MSPEIILPPIPTETDTKTSDSEINWREVLNAQMAPSAKAVELQRQWGKLSAKFRSLCPETEWIFIREEGPHENIKSLIQIERWIGRLVANPDWPFPEKVIISSQATRDYHIWKIVCDKRKKPLPYSPVANFLTLLPYKDEALTGWKITSQPSYQVNKAGEA